MRKIDTFDSWILKYNVFRIKKGMTCGKNREKYHVILCHQFQTDTNFLFGPDQIRSYR